MKESKANKDLKNKQKKTKKKKNQNAELNQKSRPKVKVVKKVVVAKVVDGKIVKQKIKRKCYALEAIEEAMKAVSEGMSLRKAGAMYGVPAATLCKKLKNPEIIGKKGGPATVLSAEEETEIIKWLIYRAETGSPVPKSELFDCIEKYLRKEHKNTVFKNNRPGKKWYVNFRRRHPQISLRVAQNLPLARAMVTEETLRQWFEEVQTYLEQKNLKHIHPSRVFNCDETNIQLHPTAEKVLVEKGARTVYKVIDAPERESATVLFMYSAQGTRAPPMLLYKYKEIPKKIVENCPADWGVGLSDSGWMNTETFYEYITRVFYPWLIKNNIEFPVIVYLDGHASHVTLPLVKFCLEKEIELITLYAHSTHIIQPLDIAFFHPLKDIYNKKAVPQWKRENNDKRLKKEDFSKVLQLALELFSEQKNVIINGFKAAGLYPFNPNNVDYNVLKKSKKCKKKPEDSEMTEKHQSTNKSGDADQHLKIFENNLPTSLLNMFKLCEESGEWLGSIENKGLFRYWLMIKKKNSGTFLIEDSGILNIECKLPTIKNIEIVNIELPREKKYNRQSGELLEVEQATTHDQSLLEEPTSSEELVDGAHVPLPDKPFEDVEQYTVDQPMDLPVSEQSFQTTVEESYPVEEVVTEPTELEQLLGEQEVGQMVTTEPVEADQITLSLVDASMENQLFITIPQDQDIVSANNDTTIWITDFNTSATEKVQVIDSTHQPISGSEDKSKRLPLHDDSNRLIENLDSSNDLNLIQETQLQDTIATDQKEKENFRQAFTLPTDYLPKTKKTKLTKGKKKLPAVGTSEEWLKIQVEKEQQQKIKEEKLAKKKELQEAKKKLADEKKRLQEQMKLLQQKIKEESL